MTKNAQPFSNISAWYPDLADSSPTVSWQGQALVSLVTELSAATSLEAVMAVTTNAARAILNADGITFVLRDGNECYYAEEDAIAPLWKGRKFPMDACISGWCMKEGRSACIEDIYADPRIPQDVYLPTFVRSMAMVPVRPEDPIAALGVYWADWHCPRENEVRILQTIANAAALALANVELQEINRTLRQGEAEQSFRIGELNHRVKNALSVVQAVANLSLRNAESIEAFKGDFPRRLQSLNTVYSLAATGTSGTVSVHELTELVLAPYRSDHGMIDVEGEDVALSVGVGVSLVVVLNELATNAAKYGALSNGVGNVSLTWTTAASERSGGPEREVRLVWQESGGPPVSAPAHSGFGMTVIRGAAHQYLGGDADIVFDPDGVRCTLVFPVGDADTGLAGQD